MKTCYSIARGQSDHGIGDVGELGKNRSGEQFIVCHPQFLQDAFLSKLTPWLSYPSPKKDIVAWSIFSRNGIDYAVQLREDIPFRDRPTYFSHALISKRDSSLFGNTLPIAGYNQLFQGSRSQPPAEKVTIEPSAPDTQFIQLNLDDIESLLAALYEAANSKRRVYTQRPATDFSENADFPKSVALAHALLPPALREDCAIRLYCRPDSFLRRAQFVASTELASAVSISEPLSVWPTDDFTGDTAKAYAARLIRMVKKSPLLACQIANQLNVAATSGKSQVLAAIDLWSALLDEAADVELLLRENINELPIKASVWGDLLQHRPFNAKATQHIISANPELVDTFLAKQPDGDISAWLSDYCLRIDSEQTLDLAITALHYGKEQAATTALRALLKKRSTLSQRDVENIMAARTSQDLPSNTEVDLLLSELTHSEAKIANYATTHEKQKNLVNIALFQGWKMVSAPALLGDEKWRFPWLRHHASDIIKSERGVNAIHPKLLVSLERLLHASGEHLRWVEAIDTKINDQKQRLTTLRELATKGKWLSWFGHTRIEANQKKRIALHSIQPEIAEKLTFEEWHEAIKLASPLAKNSLPNGTSFIAPFIDRQIEALYQATKLDPSVFRAIYDVQTDSRIIDLFHTTAERHRSLILDDDKLGRIADHLKRLPVAQIELALIEYEKKLTGSIPFSLLEDYLFGLLNKPQTASRGLAVALTPRFAGIWKNKDFLKMVARALINAVKTQTPLQATLLSGLDKKLQGIPMSRCAPTAAEWYARQPNISAFLCDNRDTPTGNDLLAALSSEKAESHPLWRKLEKLTDRQPFMYAARSLEHKPTELEPLRRLVGVLGKHPTLLTVTNQSQTIGAMLFAIRLVPADTKSDRRLLAARVILEATERPDDIWMHAFFNTMYSLYPHDFVRLDQTIAQLMNVPALRQLTPYLQKAYRIWKNQCLALRKAS